MKIILIISLIFIGSLAKGQDTTLVILEKKVAAFYYEEHLFADRARQKIESLEKRLEKEKALSVQCNSLITSYKEDSIQYTSNIKDYNTILINKEEIITDLDRTIRRERWKSRGLLLLSVVLLGLSVAN